MEELVKRDVVVFGISGDSVNTHQKYAAAERLNFGLLSDETKATCKAYGVLGKDGLPQRVSFIIDGQGTLIGIDSTVTAQFNKAGNELTSRHGLNLRTMFSDWNARIGETLPILMLYDQGGSSRPTAPWGKPATVFLTLDESEASSKLNQSVTTLESDPWSKSVAVVRVSTLKTEVKSTILEKALVDRGGSVLKHFDLSSAPMLIITDSNGVVRYRGRPSESSNVSLDRVLRELVMSVIERRPIGGIGRQ